jgi:hypothetical protein
MEGKLHRPIFLRSVLKIDFFCSTLRIAGVANAQQYIYAFMHAFA